ncbi:hypothetical protein SAMN05428642_101872 [Flaviramulus basaltis]|uniref:Uncharacterized protein n=1 Tax=Flaviramulus basaltis TaxID=369401 RepID=A0A1K2IDI5_9FLAO|nr:hypothetical protein [Flaviramulus basaltis]SFZ90330.1 hypothetical protein SAMN05428642_101872 [Flaviramulus basaltis]
MRQLNSNELLDKFRDNSIDIDYCSHKVLTVKVNQFFYFLFDQEISNRILDRISEDFEDLKIKLILVHEISNARSQKEFKESLISRELQGAFGFFEILNKYKKTNTYSKDYIDLVRDWNYYVGGGDYNDFKEDFITHFFKPFTELFEWYLSESKTLKDEDYFSFEEQNKIIIRIESLRESLERIELKIDFSGQILDEHLEDLEKLVKTLNKKNLIEIIKGKFGDEVISKLISFESFTKLIEAISGEEFKLLN